MASGESAVGGWVLCGDQTGWSVKGADGWVCGHCLETWDGSQFDLWSLEDSEQSPLCIALARHFEEKMDRSVTKGRAEPFRCE